MGLFGKLFSSDPLDRPVRVVFAGIVADADELFGAIAILMLKLDEKLKQHNCSIQMDKAIASGYKFTYPIEGNGEIVFEQNGINHFEKATITIRSVLTRDEIDTVVSSTEKLLLSEGYIPFNPNVNQYFIK